MIFLYVNIYTWREVLDKRGCATMVTATSLLMARALAGRRNPNNIVAYELQQPTVRRGVTLMTEEMSE
jgi:hypothetical protein